MLPKLHWVTSILAGTTFAAAVIDPDLKPSFPTVSTISKVDYGLSNYDRIVLLVDGKPFFYNGVQLRIDKMAGIWNMTEAEIAPFFQLAADTGFTVVNSQITWLDIQPDWRSNATQSSFVRGGSYADSNFYANTSAQIGYESGNESNQELTYLQFNFTHYSSSQIDAAKIRIYINSPPVNGANFSANLYGISNNSWSASSLTWSNAPNHNGINISGTSGTDYWLTSSNPSWDPIGKATYYDFDTSDFVINHCPGRVASFIFQPQVNDTTLTNGATLDGARSPQPPQLTLSSSQSWNFTHIDNTLAAATTAGVKLEFIWFGSDSTSATQDNRVPYFVFRYNLVKKVQSDGTVVPVFLKRTTWGDGIYLYLVDKNDLSLRALEKAAIKNLMNHVATYNIANGNKKTLIGFDVANENSITHIRGVGNTVWQNPATWGAYPNFSSQAAFVARTQWEYTVNLANAVKESNYPVWTRSNTFRTAEEKQLVYNEQQRLISGTSVDFIGLDPYSTSTGEMYTYGHQKTVIAQSNLDWSQGSNLPMVMENSGAVTGAESLNVAALAGGSFYSVYELIGPDNFGSYYATSPSGHNFTPVPRGSYVTDLIRTNKLLKTLALDLSSKRPSGAGGKNLFFFNPMSNDTLASSANVQAFPITYTPSSLSSVGIGIVRSNKTILLASTRNATFTIDGVTSYGIEDVTYGYYNAAGNWISSGTYAYTTSGSSISIAVTQGALVHVQFDAVFPIS